MSARVLLIEPDERGAAVLDRALASEGYAVERARSVRESLSLRETRGVDVALIDERAGAEMLAEVRTMRAEFPRVPVLVSGTLLSARTLRELLELGCAGALLKPFTPLELRSGVEAAMRAGRAGRLDAVDFSVAVASARGALAEGSVATARRMLARAHADAPLEPVAVRLEALCAELEGDDARAERLYRAALALETEPVSEGPHPYEALARLELYAREKLVVVAALSPTIALSPRFAWPEDARAAGLHEGPVLFTATLGLSPRATARYYRAGARTAFELCAGVRDTNDDLASARGTE